MKIKSFVKKLKENNFTSRLDKEKRYRAVVFAVFSLIFTLFFAFYNGILGIISNSVIFLFSCIYYLLLSCMRLAAVIAGRKNDREKELIVMRLIGAFLCVLSLVFSVILFFSLTQNTAAVRDEIVMITIATFTFTKITSAIVSAVKHRTEASPLLFSISSIRYAEVAVSLLTMQQSMLVSFGEMEAVKALILNIFTGVSVCLMIFVLGVITIKKSIKENSKWQNQSL